MSTCIILRTIMTNNNRIEDLLTQWRKKRRHDWFNGTWTPDDESSLSTKEFQELAKLSPGPVMPKRYNKLMKRGISHD